MLAVCALLFPAAAFGAGCVADRIDAQVTVAYVHDGDSLGLADGRKLRLIGINAPELPREDAPGQPLAGNARDALRALVESDARLGLRFDRERRDRYDRLLAHAFLEDGTNLQAWMLERGHAAAISVPPNLWSSECYRRTERRAREEGLGIWGSSYFRPLPSRRVDRETRGFRFIQGRVERIGESRRSVWLDLEGEVALRIARTDLRYFDERWLKRLSGRSVVARGWLVPRRSGLMMQVRHPFALRLSESVSPEP